MKWKLIASLVISVGVTSVSGNVFGASPDRPKALIFPCKACSPPYTGMLEASLQVGKRTVSLSTPTTMTKVNSLFTYKGERVIIVGEPAPEVSSIVIIDMRERKKMVEFWSMNWSISPDSRFILFAPFLGLHFQNSLYMDSVRYLYDVQNGMYEKAQFTRIPDGASAVFPPEILANGLRGVEHTDPRNLLLVLSSDVVWTAGDVYSFFAGRLLNSESSDAGAVYQVRSDATMTAARTEAHGSINSLIRLSCVIEDLDGRSYSSIAKSCGTQ